MERALKTNRHRRPKKQKTGNTGLEGEVILLYFGRKMYKKLIMKSLRASASFLALRLQIA